MENSIVRGAIQSLIDDSKIIDKLCDKLDCKRTEILDKIDSAGDGIATIEQIKKVLRAVDSAESSIQDARYSAEEAYDQSDSCKYNCDDASDYINGIEEITMSWKNKIKELEEIEVEADTEVVKKAPAKKLMNNFQTHNQQ